MPARRLRNCQPGSSRSGHRGADLRERTGRTRTPVRGEMRPPAPRLAAETSPTMQTAASVRPYCCTQMTPRRQHRLGLSMLPIESALRASLFHGLAGEDRQQGVRTRAPGSCLIGRSADGATQLFGGDGAFG
jgi:hypothetical protein